MRVCRYSVVWDGAVLAPLTRVHDSVLNLLDAYYGEMQVCCCCWEPACLDARLGDVYMHSLLVDLVECPSTRSCKEISRLCLCALLAPHAYPSTLPLPRVCAVLCKQPCMLAVQ